METLPLTFRGPPAERAEPVETAAEALGHSASELDGLSRNNSVEPRNTRSTRKENRGRLRAGQSKGDGFVRSSFGVAIDIRRTSLSACVFVCFVCFVVPSNA